MCTFCVLVRKCNLCFVVCVCLCTYVCYMYVRQIEIGLQLKNLIYGYFNDNDDGNNDVASCVSTCERVYFALDLKRIVYSVLTMISNMPRDFRGTRCGNTKFNRSKTFSLASRIFYYYRRLTRYDIQLYK